MESLCQVKDGILHTPDCNTPSQGQEESEGKSETQQGWGEMLSEKISSGSSYLSSMIGKGENKGEELIEKGGDKIRDSIQPNSENAEIHPVGRNRSLCWEEGDRCRSYSRRLYANKFSETNLVCRRTRV